MDKIDKALARILDGCRAMPPEELEREIESALDTPLGRMLRRFNDETVEALKAIREEEGDSGQADDQGEE